MRLGQGGDLFRTGDPTAQANVGTQILHGVARQQGLELAQAGESFAGGNRDVNMLGDERHGVEAVRT